MMKVFTVSDIHAHYHVLKEALDNAGFNETNKNHHLLVLGDLFDRGSESDLVFSYLKRLYDAKKASIILGNHDYFLLEFFNEQDDRTVFNILHNGFAETLKTFSKMDVTKDSNFDDVRTNIEKNTPSLKAFIEKLPLFIETSEYIFSHGGIDGSSKDWKNTPTKQFVWQYQYDLDPHPTKTVVVGHTRTAHIRLKEDPALKLDANNKALYQPLYRERKIFIDGFVEQSKHINVVAFDLNQEDMKHFNL